MANLTITVDLDNATFEGFNPEVEAVRILRKLADNYELGLTDRTLHDFNGNTVGKSCYNYDSKPQ